MNSNGVGQMPEVRVDAVAVDLPYIPV
jgi:hypothetical protein